MEIETSHIYEKTGKVYNSVKRGLDYLFSQLNREGSWYDFRLPPGASGPWVTAYTGYCLIEIINSKNLHKYRPALNKAVEWLIANRESNGGWGYNLFCPPDADATAYSILFLKSMGGYIPESAYTFLMKYQNSDGGFSTYRSLRQNDAWDSSHPDVTPVAGLALLELLQSHPAKMVQLRRYISDRQTEEGLWNSYWWETPLYSTARNLDFLTVTDTKINRTGLEDKIRKYRCKSDFERAFRLYCMKKLGIPAEAEMVYKLCNSQLDDGSWESVPTLRLTPRNCFEPYEESHQLYRDHNRILTSATVLQALTQYTDFR